MRTSPIAVDQAVPARKIEWLDGLRGVAALAVLLAHIRNLVLPDGLFDRAVPLGSLIQHSPLMLFTASNLAVRIFFVHSGFVLSWKYLNRPDQRILLSMCLRRALRLGIPIAVAILFAFLLMRGHLMRNGETAAITGAGAPLVSPYHFEPTFSSMIDDVMGGWFFRSSFRYDGALWTMPIELTCSYIVFLSLPLIVRWRRAALLFLAASAAILAWYPWLSYFFVGIVLVQFRRSGMFEEGGAIHNLFARSWVAWAALALTLAAVWPWQIGAMLPKFAAAAGEEAVQLFSASLFVMLLFARRPWRRILELPAIQFLGRMSFSVYLLHIPLLCSLSSALFLFLHAIGCPLLINAMATAVVTLVVAYALSWVMWRWVDRLAINIGKPALERYLYRRGSGFGPQATESPA